MKMSSRDLIAATTAGGRFRVEVRPDCVVTAVEGAFVVARPWIDGGVTYGDWEAAVDALSAALTPSRMDPP